IEVLEQLKVFYRGERVVLVWDGLSAHWSRAMQVGGPRAAAEPVELANRNLRVMPLGDSLTAGVGSSSDAGYRPYLRDELNKTAKNVDFVGSQGTGGVTDLRHEGHPGCRIDQIANVADCSVRTSKPNLVLLDAGTNDINQGHLAEAPERLRDLIDQILEDVPDAVLLVAEMGPSTKSTLDGNLKAFNHEIRQIVDARRQQGKHILAVDLDLTTADLSGEGTVHPNDDGYRKMAAAWASAIYDAAGSGWIKDPPTGEQDPRKCSGEDPSGAGPGWRALGVIAPGMSGPAGRTDLAEMNGDNRADYVRIADDGSVRVALNTVGEPGKPHWVDRGTISSPRAEAGTGDRVRFADLDGNSIDDYLLLGENGSVEVWYQFAEGDWIHGGVVAPGIQGVDPEAIRFADVTGDGRDDYLRTGANGSIHAYINTVRGTNIHWVERLNWAPGASYGSRDKLRLADVNGDKKADYIMVGGTGAVHAYFNDGGGGGGGFTPPPVLRQRDRLPRRQIHLPRHQRRWKSRLRRHLRRRLHTVLAQPGRQPVTVSLFQPASEVPQLG
ncbi:GDSL-type esterase/lipase family protein, partial [Streptomyces sp. NPDC052013]|uniref:GDSL-type esterase/lipase family protein n=1 Tax=Streptomyces sp. NPDC052013 TaxID=3365679 RepID=UPI0037D72176